MCVGGVCVCACARYITSVITGPKKSFKLSQVILPVLINPTRALWIISRAQSVGEHNSRCAVDPDLTLTGRFLSTFPPRLHVPGDLFFSSLARDPNFDMIIIEPLLDDISNSDIQLWHVRIARNSAAPTKSPKKLPVPPNAANATNAICKELLAQRRGGGAARQALPPVLPPIALHSWMRHHEPDWTSGGSEKGNMPVAVQ